MSALRLYAWPVSPYSAKVRAYLKWTGANFAEIPPPVWDLKGKIQKAVGRAIMPTVQRADGSWLQDSAEIIDVLEAEGDGPSITPPGPKQRVADLLLELHGDEWLPMAALHYRWNVPVNAAFARDEFALWGVPLLPRFLGRKVVARVADKMAAYLPRLGVDARTAPGVEAFTEQLLGRLEEHLREHRFLLGSRPCRGDFALFATPSAHLLRDPATTALVERFPRVRRWIGRLRTGEGRPGAFLEGDVVPDTLEPILATMLAEQGAYVERLIAACDAWCDEHPTEYRMPRSLGDTEFTIGGHAGTRRLLSEQLWRVWRPLDAMTPEALEWLRGLGPFEWAPRNRVVRRNFEVVRAE